VQSRGFLIWASRVGEFATSSFRDALQSIATATLAMSAPASADGMGIGVHVGGLGVGVGVGDAAYSYRDARLSFLVAVGYRGCLPLGAGPTAIEKPPLRALLLATLIFTSGC
jgi:hypothetical protein